MTFITTLNMAVLFTWTLPVMPLNVSQYSRLNIVDDDEIC